MKQFDEKEWIMTYTGQKFTLYGDSYVDLRDIAHALSNQCRFTGHVKEFYSVAQHSCLTAHLVERMGGDFYAQRDALMHDASEAYLSDLAAPFKGAVEGYREVEQHLESRIRKRFSLTGKTPLVKLSDWYALFIEADALLLWPKLSDWVGYDEYYDEAMRFGIKLTPQSPKEAEMRFLEYAGELKLE